MLLKAIQDRLKLLEEEILRITKRASEAPDQVQQDNYWRLAEDLQHEARELRSEIRRLFGPPIRGRGADSPPSAS